MYQASGLQKNTLGDDSSDAINPNLMPSDVLDNLSKSVTDAQTKIMDAAHKAQEKISSVASKVEQKVASTATPEQKAAANSTYTSYKPHVIGLAAGSLAGFLTLHFRKATKYKYIVPLAVGVGVDAVTHFAAAQIIEAKGA